MTVRTSVLWKINTHMAKKCPEKVVQRSFIKEHLFPNGLYHFLFALETVGVRQLYLLCIFNHAIFVPPLLNSIKWCEHSIKLRMFFWWVVEDLSRKRSFQGSLLSANLVHMKLMVQNNDGGFVLPCAYTLVVWVEALQTKHSHSALFVGSHHGGNRWFWSSWYWCTVWMLNLKFKSWMYFTT